LPSTPIAPIAFTQTQTQQGNQGAIGADRSTPIATDHPDRPDRLLRIDEWVSQLSEVANRDGTTYEAVKGLGVPNNLRPEIFAALTPPVKERLKGLREEFERRIPQDIEKWRKQLQLGRHWMPMLSTLSGSNLICGANAYWVSVIGLKESINRDYLIWQHRCILKHLN
jgi:hypothetical protein